MTFRSYQERVLICQTVTYHFCVVRFGSPALSYISPFRILLPDPPRLHTVKGESTAQMRYIAGPICAGTLLPVCWWKGSLLTLTRYPAMRTLFSRRTVTAIVLLLVAVVLPHQAQAQSYPIAEAMATYFEASANAEELSARANDAWALAGGTCGQDYDTEICIERAAEDRETAEEYRELAKDIRENPSLVNEPLEGNTAQDEARRWRDIADEAEGGVAQLWDRADQARQLAELGRNVRTWTRAAEAYERVAEAYEEQAEAAYVVADAWDKRAGN